MLKFSILSLLLIALIQPANGQRLLKRLKEKTQNKIEQKINDRAEKKADEKIDESLDNIEESLENKSDSIKGKSDEEKNNSAEESMDNRMQNMLKSMGMGGEPVPFENSYSFSYLIQMHIESFDKSGNSTSSGEFISHIDKESQSMAYEVISGDMAESGQGIFIIDAKNDAMLILNDKNGEKSGIVYGMGDFFENRGQTYEEEIDLSETPETYLANPNVKKTGKTKTIAGFKCEEYVYEDDESKSHVWITKDLKMNTRDFFSTLFNTSLYSHGMGWGYMLETTSINKNSGEKSVMEVTRIDKNSNKRFNLSGYQITNLGSMNMPAEEE